MWLWVIWLRNKIKGTLIHSEKIISCASNLISFRIKENIYELLAGGNLVLSTHDQSICKGLTVAEGHSCLTVPLVFLKWFALNAYVCLNFSFLLLFSSHQTKSWGGFLVQTPYVWKFEEFACVTIALYEFKMINQ